jgi:hypothetical protein
MAESAVSDAPRHAVPGQARAGPASGAPERGKIPIDSLVRSVATVGALFYVLGFLTANAYLYKLGVSDFSLPRTRFILTGVLTLAPLVLALIGGVYAALDVTLYGSHAGLTTRAYLWILIDIAFPFTLYFVLFSVVAENDVVTSARDAALLSAVCAVIVLAALAALAVYRKSERRPLSHLAYRGQPGTYDRFTERFGVPNAVVETMIFAVAGVVLILTYIGLFGQYFYPRMPEQLGGGRPRLAQDSCFRRGRARGTRARSGCHRGWPALSARRTPLGGGRELCDPFAKPPSRSRRADRARARRRCRYGRSAGPSRRR